MKKYVYRILKVLGVIILFIYLLVCGLFYFGQESILFHPEKLDPDYQFSFEDNFEEININTSDDILLNSLLFKSIDTQGLIFYLNGNGGSIKDWGYRSRDFTDLNYDVFFWDYRGFGKSGGTIASEEQFYQDAQSAYNHVKMLYQEDQIIVLGTSMGTAAASKIAAENHPDKLILISPFYSLEDMIRNIPFLKILRTVPLILLKYKFRNFENIQKVQGPVIIFHGNMDELIYYGSSLKLQEYFKSGDTLITVENGGHSIHYDSPQVKQEINRILNHTTTR